ncbi:hypothetical protein [Halomonas lysinitropha]|uniref:Uncharacterized protein n=1 Tax=Halomonas lysinitropha TaxID=2607506 RepID=A0A5K1I4J2_9GAMM|nr:hypothetical protein [Halomonas lysinitropha]VVZ96365.1 hypothetical protein HALO32_02461 [Halomonas lysinitropha]
MRCSVSAAWYPVIVAAVLSSGCSSHGTYPVEWGGLSASPGDSCPSLTGVYRNAGERAVPEGGSPQYSPPYLSSYFHANSTTAVRAKRVRITGDANAELMVEALDEAAPLEQRILQRQEDYLCEDGWLLLESSRWVAEQVSGFESMTYRFTRANDGTLVVQVSASALGVIFVVPVAGSSTEWHRFQPVESGSVRSVGQ